MTIHFSRTVALHLSVFSFLFLWHHFNVCVPFFLTPCQSLSLFNIAAVTLITVLRYGQCEPESHSETTSVQLEHSPVRSQRIVLLSRKQKRQSEKSPKSSPETNQTGAFTESEGVLKNTSPEPSELPENGNNFLDGYTGTKPLIGLNRVLECRSEDGLTCCFLCHCCRIRSNKKDIIDHLTRSSHLVNYLMEIHPEQVEGMMEDINHNYELLQSLAEKVEQEEGRGELKVVNAPESLCSLLTGKSYHWCKYRCMPIHCFSCLAINTSPTLCS